jgi:hypothetical protein
VRGDQAKTVRKIAAALKAELGEIVLEEDDES